MAAGLIGIAAGVGIAGIARLGKQALDTADNLNDLAQQTGLSVSALQSLQRLAERSGSSAEAMNGAASRRSAAPSPTGSPKPS
jgi:hypothetical protein